jgi:penicillin-binding protein 2
MNKDPKTAHVFTRRAIFIGALQTCFLGVLGARLAWLQVSQGQRYKTLSDRNRINTRMLAPGRGQIVDRFGVPLAVNNQNFRVLVVPEQTEDLEGSLRALQKYVDLSEERIQSVLNDAKKSAKFVPLEVRQDLSWDEVATIEVNLPDLPGLEIDVGEIRSYPFGSATAHIIGYVGLATRTEVEEDRLLRLPGFRTGKTGVERSYDRDLRGTAGTAQVEVNVVGREIRELSRKPGGAGKRVTLTIDGELQRFTQERLAKERSASAVVMDVHSGAVYALASHPAFDPNVFTQGISAATWEELLADPGHPLTNKAIAGQYPPASTFKMLTALAGFRTGKISRHRRVFCPGHYEFGDTRFHCWSRGGHGSVNVEEALQKSCDVYFYETALEIGIDNIAQVAREFGLGDKLGFELLEERPGLVPDRAWKMAQMGDTWKPGETIVNSIGQGYLLATPLQLAVMTARLVNGGHAVKPWITSSVGEEERTALHWPKIDISEEHLAIIKNGMDMVVNQERGTAYGSRIHDPAMAMGGKTGTAQVRRITMEQRAQGVRNEDLPWKSRHHGLFVGYAPLQNPRYVCSVVVEHGVGGSTTAAPAARDILLEVQKRDPAVSRSGAGRSPVPDTSPQKTGQEQ